MSSGSCFVLYSVCVDLLFLLWVDCVLVCFVYSECFVVYWGVLCFVFGFLCVGSLWIECVGA